MAGFGIDEVQAEYIAEIKLRNLNKQYIINRINEIEGLQAEIAHIEEILGDELKLKALISAQLTEIKKKYGQPRRSQLIHTDDVEVYDEESEVENFNARIYLTREGYFKKITMQSLRGNDEHKLKENDEILFTEETDNRSELIFVTDKAQMYRAKTADFECCKASAMGEYLPAKLGMDDGEKPVFMKIHKGFLEGENFVFIFENGKGVRVPATVYETKAPRRKLIKVYSDSSPISAVFYEKEKEPFEFIMVSNGDRAIVIKTSLVPVKTTRTSGGVTLMTLKKGQSIVDCRRDFEERYENTKGYRKLKIPAAGQILNEKDIKVQQLKIDG